MPAVEAPHVFDTSDEVLPFARAVVDHDSTARLASGEPISCHAGCAACCNQAVPISASEVRSIQLFIADQTLERQRQLETRIGDTKVRLERAGLSTEVPAPGEPARTDFVVRYFAAAVPCPLLDPDGTCGVRPVRPLACREYLVSSDPEHCRTLDSPQMVRLVSKRDAIAGFRAVSAAFEEPEIGVLALALSAAPADPPAHGPLSGVGVVQLIMSTHHTD